MFSSSGEAISRCIKICLNDGRLRDLALLKNIQIKNDDISVSIYLEMIFAMTIFFDYFF